MFRRRHRVGTNLHPHPYSSKFPPLTLQGDQEFRAALAQDSRNRACVGGEFQLAIPCIGNTHPHCEGPWKKPANDFRQRFLTATPCCPRGERRVGAQDALEGLWRARHDGWRRRGADRYANRWDAKTSGDAQLNIILVTSATARARTLTLDWRHWTLGGLALGIVFVAFTGVFNFVALKYAASIHHPWLQAIVLADQRLEAQKAQERVQGHLNAMAIRVGELQAQLMRLDGLGEHLAKVAGLKPQDLRSIGRNCKEKKKSKYRHQRH